MLPRARSTSLSEFFAGRESFDDELGYVPLYLRWEAGTPCLRLLDSGWQAEGSSGVELETALAVLGDLDERGVRLQLGAGLDMQRVVDALDELRERGIERIAID